MELIYDLAADATYVCIADEDGRSAAVSSDSLSGSVCVDSLDGEVVGVDFLCAPNSITEPMLTLVSEHYPEAARQVREMLDRV